MPNSLLLFTVQIIAMLSVLLLAAGYLKAEPRAGSARVFALMAVFIIFYLLNGMAGQHIDPQFQLDLSSWQLIILIGMDAIPGLFMIYCFLIFQEQQKFPTLLVVAFATQAVLDTILSGMSLYSSGGVGSGSLAILRTCMDVMTLAFVASAMYWTLKGWRADLVDDRRVLRWFIIGVQGALIFSVLFVENFLLDGGSSSYATAQVIIVSLIAFLATGMLLVAMRFDYVSLSNVIRKVTELTEEAEPENKAPFDKESFNKVFKEGKLYREAGLTISMLAKKLNLPEYRLRAFIHKKLGYRNFNAMLHKYRIEDAGDALADKDNPNVPVLTIALSVGYQSITPFNNAFRELMGVTPSEYRKREIAAKS
ncbi:MAG: helix-turn-helix domain-containing protein [Proteobacteria bacterium]|nr:helix-turn-helix domain-containing protein [Pseudomonadota bacterium]MDA1291116.1 helix-turn-helix domain-containing protein [Pseudomonadota bacterium]